jgi:hypothetical protein
LRLMHKVNSSNLKVGSGLHKNKAPEINYSHSICFLQFKKKKKIIGKNTNENRWAFQQ